MSAESGRGSKPIFGHQVRPEPVVEKSFVENVAGIINEVCSRVYDIVWMDNSTSEVAPQTYSNPAHYEGKEQITWVRFDYCDINDLHCFRDKIEANGNAPPLLLLVGYTNGVQAWIIPANGEAVEVFSWRQGAVRTLKILLSPSTSETTVDLFSLKRPIVAICDTAGPGPQFCSLSFISMKTGEQVKSIKFKNQVQDIHANKNVVVVSFFEKLAVFDAATYEDLFTITNCYPAPGPNLNPISLSDQWLAYTERKLFPIFQSSGGMVSECSSYRSTVLHAAKSIGKSMKELSETVASMIGPRQSTPPLQNPTPPPNNVIPGVVTIIDTQKVTSDEVSLASGVCDSVVAHFVAHQGAPVVAMSFDPSGMLLATADKQGHSFHLFRIVPHPLSASQTAIHHLYTLYRGDTTAKVIDMSFSLDSRWMAVSTHRGTTHVFPITPYGGCIGVRTHTSVCVVNRLSTFQKSAGLDDTSSGRNSPILSSSPGSCKFMFEHSANLAYPNPRFPPFPNPIVVKPLVQLRQPLLKNLIDSISTGPSPSRSPPTTKSKVSSGDDVIKVSSIFASPRGWLASSPTVPRETKRRAMDALFVMAYHGNLIEYYLDPVPASTIPSEKVTEDSLIELQVHATAQWPLVRESTSKEIRPPLDSNSLLLAPLLPGRPRSMSPTSSMEMDDPEERWMAQVEIHTHAGPHRRLWMGPQFTFKAILQTGSLAGTGGSNYKETSFSDPSLGCPVRSSPVNMPGSGGSSLPVLIEAGSLTGSHDQSPRLTEKFGENFDPETIMTRLRHDIADAMMDSPHAVDQPDSGGNKKRVVQKRAPCSMQTLPPPLFGAVLITVGDRSSSIWGSGDEKGFDMSDVMDISCDPPGPSSGRPTPSSQPTSLSDPPEEEIQSVTTHLSQVAVTKNLPALPAIIGSRTPSLEESRGLTSSAEELSTALGSGYHHGKKANENVWVPIDRPSKKSLSESPDTIFVERPEPRELKRHAKTSTNPWAGSVQPQDNFSSDLRSSSSSAITTATTNTTTTGLAWNRIASGKKQSSESPGPYASSGFSSVPLVSVDMCSDSHFNVKSVKSLVPSTTTSEDDMVATIESKRDKKKKKRKAVKNGAEVSNESPKTSNLESDDSPFPQSLSNSKLKKEKDFLTSTIKVEADHFQPDYVGNYPAESQSVSADNYQPDVVDNYQIDDYPSDSIDDYQSGSIDDYQSGSIDDYQSRSIDDYQSRSMEDYHSGSVDNYQTNQVDNFQPDLVDDYQLDPADGYGSDPVEDYRSDPVDEYRPASIDEFHDPIVNEYFEEPAPEDLNPFIEDFQEENFSEIESCNNTDSGLLRSIHDDNDLARALEEAYSSDDNVVVPASPVNRTAKTKSERTTEMFPFRESSSEDDRGNLRLRTVVNNPPKPTVQPTPLSRIAGFEEVSTDENKEETSGDDRAESSADDRKNTSESDVGMSPNPRTSSNSKNKRKKKKKR